MPHPLAKNSKQINNVEAPVLLKTDCDLCF